MSIIKKSFIFFLKKKYGKLKNYKIFFNYKNGEIEIWRDLKIVSDEIIKNFNKQIEISKAIKIKKNLKIGDSLKEKIEYQQLGKKFLFSLKKDLLYKFKKFERKNQLQIFKKKIGEIIYAKVDYIMNDNIFFKNNENENNKMILLKEEQIPNEKFKKGNSFFLLIKKVKFIKNKIYLLLSRKDKNFLKKLLELEIPEISNGLIIIKKIVRIAGERSKIAIKSKNQTIDPIGTCVGLKGSKLKNIIKEINNEILKNKKFFFSSKEEFLFHELIDYKLFNNKYCFIGKIKTIYYRFLQNLLELNFNKKKYFLPLVKDFFLKKNKKKKILILKLPKGLLNNGLD
ncbi:MAG: NusA N-terminal domain-containing protein [Candidatus Karelsulcia muelleri]